MVIDTIHRELTEDDKNLFTGLSKEKKLTLTNIIDSRMITERERMSRSIQEEDKPKRYPIYLQMQEEAKTVLEKGEHFDDPKQISDLIETLSFI